MQSRHLALIAARREFDELGIGFLLGAQRRPAGDLAGDLRLVSGWGDRAFSSENAA